MPEAGSVDASIIDATSEPPIVDASAEEANSCLSWQGLQQESPEGPGRRGRRGPRGTGRLRRVDVRNCRRLRPVLQADCRRQRCLHGGSDVPLRPVTSSNGLRELVAPDGHSYICGGGARQRRNPPGEEGPQHGDVPACPRVQRCTLGLAASDAAAEGSSPARAWATPALLSDTDAAPTMQAACTACGASNCGAPQGSCCGDPNMVVVGTGEAPACQVFVSCVWSEFLTLLAASDAGAGPAAEVAAFMKAQAACAGTSPV